MIKIEDLEEIIMRLPKKKKGTKEGITNNILKAAFYVIKEFVDVVNNFLRRLLFRWLENIHDNNRF